MYENKDENPNKQKKQDDRSSPFRKGKKNHQKGTSPHLSPKHRGSATAKSPSNSPKQRASLKSPNSSTQIPNLQKSLESVKQVSTLPDLPLKFTKKLAAPIPLEKQLPRFFIYFCEHFFKNNR